MTLLSLMTGFLLWMCCATHKASAGAACEDPPLIEFGKIVSGVKSEYEENDRVQYTCNPGYALSGSERVTCHGKVWMPGPPQCLERPCGSIPAVANAAFEGRSKEKYEPGETVRYQCHEGFQITGPPEIFCRRGNWSTPPICEGEGGKCGPPPDIENGDILSFQLKQYPQGATLKYKCASFYILKGPEQITCTDGQWTNPPVCLAACTASEEDMDRNNIMLKWSGESKLYLKSGDFVEFDCKIGYVQDPASSPFRVQCMDGTLEYPWCKPGKILCSPPRVPNGNFRPQEDSYREGAVITIDCNPGYRLRTLSGKNTAQCTSRGWVPAPDCVEKPCDYPVIENGKISERMAHFYFPMRIGQYVDYHCRNGYLAPNGERVVRIFCSKGGWNPEPKCLKTCSVTHLENGYFRYNRYTYTEGERIQYVCNQDYRTESEGGEVTCTKNGWSPFPRCIRKMVCTASEEDMDRNNIELRWRGERKLYSTSGDFVEFDCKIGYVQDPASSPFRVQCMDGTLEYPRCKPGRNCSLSETAMERNNIKLRHSRRRSDIYRSKETISFTCYFLFREVSNPEDFDAQCQDGVINYPRCERTFG
ncbi:complement factor H-like isoform 4-T4 [Mergus octosetaceus]